MLRSSGLEQNLGQTSTQIQKKRSIFQPEDTGPFRKPADAMDFFQKPQQWADFSDDDDDDDVQPLSFSSVSKKQIKPQELPPSSKKPVQVQTFSSSSVSKKKTKEPEFPSTKKSEPQEEVRPFSFSSLSKKKTKQEERDWQKGVNDDNDENFTPLTSSITIQKKTKSLDDDAWMFGQPKEDENKALSRTKAVSKKKVKSLHEDVGLDSRGKMTDQKYDDYLKDEPEPFAIVLPTEEAQNEDYEEITAFMKYASKSGLFPEIRRIYANMIKNKDQDVNEEEVGVQFLTFLDRLLLIAQIGTAKATGNSIVGAVLKQMKQEGKSRPSGADNRNLATVFLAETKEVLSFEENILEETKEFVERFDNVVKQHLQTNGQATKFRY